VLLLLLVLALLLLLVLQQPLPLVLVLMLGGLLATCCAGHQRAGMAAAGLCAWRCSLMMQECCGHQVCALC
jgi:hypothetical protein